MVNVTEQILVDGVTVEVKILEEWGFNMGEDVCLFENDDKSVNSCPEEEVPFDELDSNKNVEILAANIDKEMATVE